MKPKPKKKEGGCFLGSVGNSCSEIQARGSLQTSVCTEPGTEVPPIPRHPRSGCPHIRRCLGTAGQTWGVSELPEIESDFLSMRPLTGEEQWHLKSVQGTAREPGIFQPLNPHLPTFQPSPAFHASPEKGRLIEIASNS